jgi:chromosome segregation ATPase
MRKLICTMAVFLVLIPTLTLAGHSSSWHFSNHDTDNLFRDDRVSIDFDHKVLILEYRDGRETVEISRDGKLVVNDRQVKLDRREKNLMKRYHAEMNRMTELATDMGFKGAKIGLKGSKLGGMAALHVIKELFSNLDNLDELDEVMEDIEMEFEDVGDELEELGEELEEIGEELEDVMDDLDETHRRARSKITELDDLGWF